MINLKDRNRLSIKSSTLYKPIINLSQGINHLERCNLGINSLEQITKDISALTKNVDRLTSLKEHIIDEEAKKIIQNENSINKFFEKVSDFVLNANPEQLCFQWKNMIKIHQKNKQYKDELTLITRLEKQGYYYLYRDNRDQLQIFSDIKDMVKFKLNND